MSSDATFTLDGKTIPFQPGDTIMDAALRAGEYIYVRVTQVDGGAAWSSPVFVRSAR